MRVDHGDIAQYVYFAQPPERTTIGVLGYLARLLAALPADEHAGYLLKPAGENIAPLSDGSLVSIARVCYPDGQIYKVLTDVPNGQPEWSDDGTVDPARYLAFTVDAAQSTEPAPPSSVEQQLAAFAATLKDIDTHLEALRLQADANTEKIQQQIDQVVKNAEATGRALAPIVEAALPALAGLFVRK